MNTSPRITTLIALLIVACVSIVGLRVSAQSSSKRAVDQSATRSDTLTLTFSGAKLKPKCYQDDADLFDSDILQKHGAAYCVKHSQKPGHLYQHGNVSCDSNTSAADQEKSQIIAVINASPSPTPIPSPSVPLTGTHVTQQISTSSVADMMQVLSAFE